jgi:hypothetical protein
MRPFLAWRLPVILAGLALLLPGCAKRGLPPGGPEDKTAPFVDGIEPVSGSVDAPLTGQVRLTFSEPMKQRTVETAVVMSPPVKWTKRYWNRNTYILESDERLAPSTTYLVSVGTAAADRHGIRMENSFVAGFSTGSTIEAGIMSGKVTWKGLTVEQALVEVFDAAGLVAPIAAFPSANPAYVVVTGAGGKYEIPFINTRTAYRVLAFADVNHNSEYDQGEAIGCAGGPVAFHDSLTRSGVDMMLCDTSLKGSLAGTVHVVSRPDTSVSADTTKMRAQAKVAVTARSLEDATISYRALADKDGLFKMDCVTPGKYLVMAFADYNGNQKKDPEDSFYVEMKDTIGVEPCAGPSKIEMTLEIGDRP